MTRVISIRTLALALAAGLAVFAGVMILGRPSGGPPPAAAGFTPVQRDQGQGGVEIEVVYATPDVVRSGQAQEAARFDPARHAVFLVSMNTHTVDLSAYAMKDLSTLRGGGAVLAPLRWESLSDNPHHRSGALVFPLVRPPLPAELVIRTIGGVPDRVFRWTP